jgi:hypothetical protein
MLEVADRSDDKIRCDACPVNCYIKPGMAGACDRYANHDGEPVHYRDRRRHHLSRL